MEIITGSRLHFGIVNINNPKYPLFKCAGCAIEEPKLRAKFEESNKLSLEISRRDILPKLKKYAESFSVKIKFKTLEEIPSHIGLGSTTQLCLAFAYSLHELNKKTFDVYEVAAKLNLGEVSGIGIASFMKGGFIIDTGKVDKEIPRIEFRAEFPTEWVFVLLRDINAKKGLYGVKEKEAFSKLEVTSEERILEMYSLLEQMKDALKSKDIEMFGKSLTKFQFMTGLNFKKAQEGIFSSKTIEDLVNFLLKNGAFGAGQSSWGPIVYGLFLKDTLKITLLQNKLPDNIEIKVTNANNKGFKIVLTNI